MKKTIKLMYFCFFSSLLAGDQVVRDSKEQEQLVQEAKLLMAMGLSHLATPEVRAAYNACIDKKPVLD